MAIKAVFLASLVGCYKNHLYVQQEWVDSQFLASAHVGTPDPRLADPPEGQGLLLAWRFPDHLFEENLIFVITVRLWNNSEKILTKSVEEQRGSMAFYFPNKGLEQDLRILTYKIEVFNEEDELVEEWKHHFWRELIELHPESS